MRRFLRKRRGCFVAILLTCSLSLLSTTGSAGVWDVIGSNPITILAHSPTIDGFPIENMFGATSQHPTFGTVDHAIFRDESGDVGYVDYVEWRTSAPIDLPGFSLYANKDGSTNNRMFTWLTLYYSEDSGSTWIRFYTKNVVNDYSDGYLNINVPRSSFIRPVSGKQYFRAEFVRGGGDPNIDGPRVRELDAWPSFSVVEVTSDNREESGWRLRADLGLVCPLSPTATVAYSVNGGSANPMRDVTFPYYQDQGIYLWEGWVTDQLGGLPSDYNGSTFTYTVDDGNRITATATVTAGIRKIPLSTNLTISGDPTHPTVSWYNSDSNIDGYTVRISVGVDSGWVWQTSLPFSSNPSYTISDYTFEPGVEYGVRIEAREFVNFPLEAGSDIPTLPGWENFVLMNRSTVVRSYWIPEEGDFDGDHFVSLADAITALKVIAGVNVVKALWKNEINGDGRIGLEDVTCVLQYAAGIRNSPYTDIDGDGYTGKQGDCDDTDSNIYPGAEEICGDGIDQDCDGTDLACPPPCANIAGYWNASDTVTMTCCVGGECETDTFGGADSITIQQNACEISYDLHMSGYGTFTRTGTVAGNNVHVSGIFAVLQPGCMASQNWVDLNGTVGGDRIELLGSGIIRGTCDGYSFECTGTSISTLTR